MDGELKRLLKVMAAHREETITDALTRMAWWYVDGTDELMLDAIEVALSFFKARWAQTDNHPADSMAEYVDDLGIALGRAKMRMSDVDH